MYRRGGVLRILGAVGMVAAMAMGMAAAWPSARQSLRVEIDSVPLPILGNAPSGASVAQAGSVPALSVQIDLPVVALSGRRERVGMSVDSAPAAVPLTLSAGIVSPDLRAIPPGESGQAFRPAAVFSWTITTTRAPEATATVVLRIRHAGGDGAGPADRLLMAREVRLRVRTIAGLSAPLAGWTAGLLAIASMAAQVAAIRRRHD